MLGGVLKRDLDFFLGHPTSLDQQAVFSCGFEHTTKSLLIIRAVLFTHTRCIASISQCLRPQQRLRSFVLSARETRRRSKCFVRPSRHHRNEELGLTTTSRFGERLDEEEGDRGHLRFPPLSAIHPVHPTATCKRQWHSYCESDPAGRREAGSVGFEERYSAPLFVGEQSGACASGSRTIGCEPGTAGTFRKKILSPLRNSRNTIQGFLAFARVLVYSSPISPFETRHTVFCFPCE